MGPTIRSGLYDSMMRFVKSILSRRFAVGAMALLATIIGLSTLVPTGDDLARLKQRRPSLAAAVERLNPQEVSRSPLALGLISYVAVSVVVSMATRIRDRRRQGVIWPPHLERFAVRRSVRMAAAPADAEARVRAVFERHGNRVDAALVGGGGRGGFWGSMAFHAGLLVGLAGIALSARGRFNGELALVEGFPVNVSPASFLRATPPDGLRDLAARLEVSDVAATYASGRNLVDVSAVLHAAGTYGSLGDRFVSVNVPTTIDGYQFTVHAYGYAPLVRAVDRQGRVRADGFAVLKVLPPGTRDRVEIGEGEALELRFYPDHVEVGGASASRSMDPLNPVLTFEWTSGGHTVARGAVARGEQVTIGGYTVTFDGYRYWLDFIVGRDPGIAWFALGSLLAVAGLAVRYSLHERAWRVTVAARADGGSDVDFVLSARYLPVALERAAERIAAGLAAS